MDRKREEDRQKELQQRKLEDRPKIELTTKPDRETTASTLSSSSRPTSPNPFRDLEASSPRPPAESPRSLQVTGNSNNNDVSNSISNNNNAVAVSSGGNNNQQHTNLLPEKGRENERKRKNVLERKEKETERLREREKERKKKNREIGRLTLKA